MSPAMPLPPLPPDVAATTERALLEKGTGRVYGGLRKTDLVGIEQRRVGHARSGRTQPARPPGGGVRDPAPRRAGEQPRPDEERIGYGLDRLRLFGDGDRQRREP